jgi:hypothetical protein
MEEVVGFGWFFRNNRDLYERYPKVLKNYLNISEMGFAAGVYEEFIPFFGVSLLAYYFPGQFLYALWYGMFIALTAHFVMHILCVVIVRRYIPSVITSIICLPVSVLILIRCASFMPFDSNDLFGISTGIVILIVNFIIIHPLMKFITKASGFPSVQSQ